MKEKSKHILKIIMAILIAAGVFVGLVDSFQLKKFYWQNDIIHDFYEEPKDTIEVAFLGSSHVVYGITPMELYRDYGICAYDIGTSVQPLGASYYWLQEVWNYHKESLKTIVLESSMLRRESQDVFFWNAYSGMRNSEIKMEAVNDYFIGEYGNGSWKDVLDHINPLTEGHSRWKELRKSNFETMQSDICRRGYVYSERREALKGNAIGQNFFLEKVLDDTAEPTELNEKSLYYYKKILNFCKNHELQLVLLATPTTQWTSDDHNAVQKLAEEDGLTFLDFNVGELTEKIELSYEANACDYNHLNYFGATKVTNYIGEYLIENGEATDIRGEEKYQFMEEELADYNEDVIRKIQLSNIVSPEEYLENVIQDINNTIFITVRDDASGAIKEEQKVRLSNLGLKHFQFIAYPKAYLAVIDAGKVIYEKIEENMDGTDDEKYQNAGKLEFSGILSDGTRYYLSSSGYFAENKASCIIDGEEESTNQRGLNFVVYNKKTHKVVDSTYFDTWASPTRSMADRELELKEAMDAGKTYDQLTDDSKALYRYNYKDQCLTEKKKLHLECKSNRVFDFLDAYSKEGKAVFISVRDEASNTFNDEIRKKFQTRGLESLATLQFQDSYLAVIKDGAVLYEQKDHGEIPIEFKDVGYQMISGGMKSGNISSIKINGEEYSLQTRGLNIVVYDEFLDEVVDQISFDTFKEAIMY